jgi:hypothetical protein
VPVSEGVFEQFGTDTRMGSNERNGYRKKYATRGIATEIGLDTQMILWAMLDKRKAKGIQVDYLQVFELSIARKDGVLVQKVLHK